MNANYYKISITSGETLFIKNWDTGCLVIKKDGDSYKVENFKVPYKKQDGDLATEITYFQFKDEFLRASTQHKSLSLK